LQDDSATNFRGSTTVGKSAYLIIKSFEESGNW